MNIFDLKKVHDLISFKDVCTTDNEYMSEASCLPHIELETEPLYVIVPKMPVLFTTKLRYYRKVVENEINRYINAATNLLEGEEAEDLTKFVLKKMRESVTTLANESKRQLTQFDYSGNNWKNITSDKPVIKMYNKALHEYVVFLHYVIAELARCWMELQDRYAYVIGDGGCYDVSLFYTSIVGCNPDEEFKIELSDKYAEETKKFKKVRTDCSFLYENVDYFAIAIQEFTNKLKEHQLIEQTVDLKQMETIFNGHSCRTTIKWIGEPHILTWIIKGLCTDDNPIVTTWPEGTSKWHVVSCRFLNKDGNPMPNIRKESARKKTELIIKEAISAFSGYLRKI